MIEETVLGESTGVLCSVLQLLLSCKLLQNKMLRVGLERTSTVHVSDLYGSTLCVRAWRYDSWAPLR